MIASTRIEFADITGYSFEKASPTLRSGFQNTLLFILYCIMLYSSWGFAEQRKPNRLVLEIFHRDSPKPSLSISCDAPNFYPGWENARRLLPVQEGIYWELYT